MERHWNVVAVLGLLALIAPNTGSPQSADRPSDDVENFVRHVFFLNRSSGSLSLSGTCRENGGISAALSKTPAGSFKKVEDALNSLSKSNPQVTWTRDSGGMIRIRDQKVDDDVLRIHLEEVDFKNAASADEAVRTVMFNPKVRQFFKDHHIEYGLAFNNLRGSEPIGGAGLSAHLRDVTVGNALDFIVGRFPGLWTYKECRIGELRRVVVDTFAVNLTAPNSSK